MGREMSSRWHPITVYFGLAEVTEDDRQIREEVPPPSMARFVVAFVSPELSSAAHRVREV
jgi:hypothetical protein